jgi:hypothetical protein
VKLEPMFELGGDFGREGRVLRRALGYRQHRHMRLAAFVFRDRGANGARSFKPSSHPRRSLFQT